MLRSSKADRHGYPLQPHSTAETIGRNIKTLAGEVVAGKADQVHRVIIRKHNSEFQRSDRKAAGKIGREASKHSPSLLITSF